MIDASNLRDVVGKTLLGRSGVRVGKVTSVYEGTGGEGTFAAVKTGLFGGHSTFVPLAEAEVHGDNVHVPYSKETIDDAPRIEGDAELTPPQEERLFAHYGIVAAPHRAAAPAAEDGVLTRSEERVHVGTERVETGRARLRKYVVTETVTQTVPVSHEELRIVREPLEPGAPGVPEVDALSEEVHEIVLSAERPVVQREVVPVERIRLATESIAGEETVTEQVRKEQVEVLADHPVQETFAPPAAPPPADTSSEFFVSPREADEGGIPVDLGAGAATTGTSSEFFVSPREADEGGIPVDLGAGAATTGTSSEFFLSPREADEGGIPVDLGATSAADGATRAFERPDSDSSSELFLAPREDDGPGDAPRT